MDVASLPWTRFSRIAVVGVFVVAFAPLNAFAQQNRSNDRGFWVTGTAEVTVSADQALIVMQLRSTAATEAEALERNEQATEQLSQLLNSHNPLLKYTFTSSRLISATSRNMAPRLYQLGLTPQPMRPYPPAPSFQPSAAEASRYYSH